MADRDVVITSGKYKGRRIGDLSDNELQLVWGAWNGFEKLRKQEVFSAMTREKDRRNGLAPKIPPEPVMRKVIPEHRLDASKLSAGQLMYRCGQEVDGFMVAREGNVWVVSGSHIKGWIESPSLTDALTSALAASKKRATA